MHGFNNRSSRSCTLVDLQDVYLYEQGGPYMLTVHSQEKGVTGRESDESRQCVQEQ